jgi:ribosomal protein L29
MSKFKELSKLDGKEIDKRINDIKLDIIKGKVTAAKGGKVKMRELKKTLARLLMLKARNNKSGGEKKQ